MSDAKTQLPDATSLPSHAVVKRFLDREQCQSLAEFAQELFTQELLTRNVFQVNTWMARIDQRTLRPCTNDSRWKLCEDILDRIVQLVEASDRVMDPVYGDFISFMTPGALVRPHRDDWKMDVFATGACESSRDSQVGPDGGSGTSETARAPCQVRCNVFLQKQPGSGDPLLADSDVPPVRLAPVHDLDTGDLLIFSPTRTIHAASKVEGTPRIMASYSFLTTTDWLAAVLQRAGNADIAAR